jgi:hypothetical protein
MSNFYILLSNSRFAQVEYVHGDYHIKPVDFNSSTRFTDLSVAKKIARGINSGELGISTYHSDFQATRVFECV